MTARWAIPAVALLAAAAGMKARAAAPVLILFVDRDQNEALVVGASRGERWIPWNEAHRLVRRGATFRFWPPSGSPLQRTLSAPRLSQASGEAYWVRPTRGFPTGVRLVGLAGAAWNPTPRKPARVEPSALEPALARFLQSKGISHPAPRVRSAWRVDLDRDGAAETVLEAESPGYLDRVRNADSPRAGDYTLVLLARGDGADARLTTVVGALFPRAPAEGTLAERVELSHLVDLNGDGRMEIVAATSYYEGAGVLVFELRRGAARQVLAASDGL